jgi:hypothetical protein
VNKAVIRLTHFFAPPHVLTRAAAAPSSSRLDDAAVDCDLRSPSLTAFFVASPSAGARRMAPLATRASFAPPSPSPALLGLTASACALRPLAIR